MGIAIANTDQLLEERGKTHGEYSEHAFVTQSIMRVLQTGRSYEKLSDCQKESLHMFAHKMGRIVTGDPDLNDHWDDIAGYARLVSQRIPGSASTQFLGVVRDDDPYAIAGAILGLSRDEAKRQFYLKLYGSSPADPAALAAVEKAVRPAAEPEPDDGAAEMAARLVPRFSFADGPLRPGTPEDGGHHASAEADEGDPD